MTASKDGLITIKAEQNISRKTAYGTFQSIRSLEKSVQAPTNIIEKGLDCVTATFENGTLTNDFGESTAAIKDKESTVDEENSSRRIVDSLADQEENKNSEAKSV